MKRTLGLVLLLTIGMNIQTHSQDYTIKIVDKNEIKAVLPEVSNLWLSTFREYPYLYVGNIEIAYTYFDWIASKGKMAVAYKDQNPVGFITAVPLKEFAKRFSQLSELFKQENLDINDYYYIADVITMPEHRGNKISHTFFELIEDHAKCLGYPKACFMCECHQYHPLKPKDYRELDTLWLKLGYAKTNIVASFDWLTVQCDSQIQQQDHRLIYWIKNLN